MSQKRFFDKLECDHSSLVLHAIVEDYKSLYISNKKLQKYPMVAPMITSMVAPVVAPMVAPVVAPMVASIVALVVAQTVAPEVAPRIAPVTTQIVTLEVTPLITPCQAWSHMKKSSLLCKYHKLSKTFYRGIDGSFHDKPKEANQLV